ncbi:potassium channel subfamily K member 18-like [Anabrus simplex]|uniref:potassium channel subfamily K member 18-like n=1 Tax=Anabrus simplex TaxID=316456 RepID=UPI0035A30521
MLSDSRGGTPSSPSSPPYPDYRHHHHHHHQTYQQAYQQTAYKHQHSPPSSPSSASSTSRCCSFRRGCCVLGSSRRGGRRGSTPSICCCCYCPASAVSSSVFSSLGVCALVLGYTLLGAFTFMALEGGMKDNNVAVGVVLGEDIRSKTVEKLWSITEDLNILYKDNWTRLAAQEVLKFQDTLVRNLRGYRKGSGAAPNGGALYYSHHHHRWSFSSSFLYSLTLITTIGYGSVAPKTPWGKVITIVYALIGIPLMLVYLSTVGDVLARNFRRLYGRLCGSNSTSGACNGRAGGKGSSNSSKSKLSASTDTYLSTGYSSSATGKGHNNISADGSAVKLHHYHTHGPDHGSDDLAKMDRTGSVVVLDCGGEGIGPSSTSSSTALDPSGKRRRHGDGAVVCSEPVRIPVSLCLLIVLLYICGGALLFNRLENWSFLEGSYFCFTSLGTIGFGDLIPGLYHSYQIQYQTSQANSSSSAEQLSVFASSAYILLGMALIAMCFNLVQDEVVIIVRRLAQYFGVGASRSDEDDEMMGDVVDGEGIAMSVVSS